MSICIDYEIVAGVFYCQMGDLPRRNLVYAVEELEEKEPDTVSVVAEAIKESQNETNELLHKVINMLENQ
jgi:hypothetical protein